MSDTPRIITLEPVVTAVIRETVVMAEAHVFFDRAFQVLPGVLGAQEIAPTGAAFARYYGAPGETADIEVGFPTAAVIVADDGVVPGQLPGGRTATTVHRGSFDGLGDAWRALHAWIESQGESAADEMWEIYVTEPSPDMDPADLITELYWPIA